MSLSTVYQNITFHSFSPRVQKVLDNITLTTFLRIREGKKQTFVFTFLCKNKPFVFYHQFSYHGKGVAHWFHLEKPFFSRSPFRFTKKEYEQFSNELMKAVNQWHSLDQKNKME